MFSRETKTILIALLTVLVVCMVPLMGPQASASGHLHHDASASCATCMGSISLLIFVFSLALLGLQLLLIPVARLLALPADRFHPPYVPTLL
jgi:hypothetical protein